ncbi:MAG: sigma-70 family RNA polymerase sigma factor, partial [Pseudoruminococcus massiliensis]
MCRFLSKSRTSLLLAWAAVLRLPIWIKKNSDWRKTIMAYNKAREERKWRIWKQSEEKKLRELGVSDDNISKLRKHDWANFNSDRRYYQRVQDTGTYLDELAASEQDG